MMNTATSTTMKRLIPVAFVLLTLAVLASAISPRFDERGYTLLADSLTARSEFNHWARENRRSYASQEFVYRYNVWRDNSAYIDHFNANANASFTLAINEMGDLTQEEVSRVYTGLMTPISVAGIDQRTLAEAEAEAQREIVARQVPSSYDWRTEGAVTAVKDQGSCGACYAFSANGATEGMYKIATGQLNSLSEQMILDCAQGTGNLGCNGGSMDVTFSWIINNGGGVNTEASYPWTGVSSTCRYNAANNGAIIKGYRQGAAGSESALLTLAASGPVSVGIDASTRSFTYYSSGTLNDPTCTAAGIDHAVTVIGWGTDSSNNAYWLIKNSWGTSWGMSGFAQIARNAGNMCGIASMASQPCYTSTCT